MRVRASILLAVLLSALTAFGQEIIVLRNATVVPEPGRRLERTDVLIRGGVIAEVGSGISAPNVAKEFDCSGLTVYAGFVHPALSVTLESLSQRLQEVQGQPTPGDIWNRRDNLLTRFGLADFRSDELPALRNLAEGGYGVAHLFDGRGVLGPRACVVSTAQGALNPSAIVSADTGIPISLSGGGFGFGRGYPGSLMGRIAFARQALTDAGWHDRLLRAYEANPTGKPRPGRDPDLEAARDLVRAETFAIFDRLDDQMALRALALSNAHGLKPMLIFASGAGRVSDALSLRRGAVALSDRLPSRPRLEGDNNRNSLSSVVNYFNDIQAGAELDRAGVPFVYAPSSASSPLDGIRTYVAAGLNPDAALAAMTTRPAAMLGLTRQVGKVEKGFLANLVVVEGDLFSSDAKVMLSIVEGKPLSDKLPEKRDPAEVKPIERLPLMPPDYSPFPRPAESAPAFRMYRNATIWTMSSAGVLTNADIVIRDGKVLAVGKGLQPPAGCEVIDATGLHISPGVYDAHSHTAITGGVNEGSNMVTIECRIEDVINAQDTNIYRQLAGGTVGALMLHGSANPIGGQSITVKWRWGKRAEDLPVKSAPPGVKFALGQNPIREDQGRGRQQEEQPTDRPRTRMGVMDAIRRAFDDALDYRKQWDDFRAGRTSVEPRKNLQLEAILEVLDGTRKVHSHGYRSDEMLALLRLAEEYGVRVATLQHVLEGYKIADEMARHGVGGSTFADWWGYKLEAYDAIPDNAALMSQRGVLVSVNSDSSDQARRLNFEAAKSIRYGGVSPETALSFVTIGPAKQLGIDRWTGSLEPGKDADLVVWSAAPTSIFAICRETYVDGVKLFDFRHDRDERARREQVLNEARRLLNGDDTQAPAEAGTGPAAEDEDLAPATLKPLPAVAASPGNAKYPRKPVVIRGATIHSMVGQPAVGDVLIGEDGRIQAVGSVNAPRGAEIVDARGKHLYPGLIDPATMLGLNEIGQVPVSDDTSERGDFNARLAAGIAVNPDSETIGVARAAGVLTAVAMPTGGTVSGLAALLSLDGYTWEDLSYTNSFALVVNVGASERVLERVDEWFAEARSYMERRAAAARGETPAIPIDRNLEVVHAALSGELPLLVTVSTPNVVEAVTGWAAQRGVSILLVGGPELVEVADLLAKTRTPVAISGTTGVPSGDAPYDDDYTVPARLREAGVKFCFTTRDAHNVRWLRDLAGFAAAWGMWPEDAERAVTLWPAEMLGLGSRLGAITPGRDGTVILLDGPLLETGSRVEQAWILGRPVSLQNRQTILRDRYSSRPLPAVTAKSGDGD
ncbi:MAG: amidohydrolase family protein [Armatimonadota bacterium]